MKNGIVEERRQCVQVIVKQENGNGVEYVKIPNYVKRDFMTENERKFHKSLVSLVCKMRYKTKYNTINISSQVAVNRLISVNNQRIAKLADDIWAKSVDFVLYSPNYNEVICVIELDSREHCEKIKTIDRDFALEQAFKTCEIPFIRIKSNSNLVDYDAKDIYDILKQERNYRLGMGVLKTPFFTN